MLIGVPYEFVIEQRLFAVSFLHNDDDMNILKNGKIFTDMPIYIFGVGWLADRPYPAGPRPVWKIRPSRCRTSCLECPK
jgi:hypothetical protein